MTSEGTLEESVAFLENAISAQADRMASLVTAIISEFTTAETFDAAAVRIRRMAPVLL